MSRKPAVAPRASIGGGGGGVPGALAISSDDMCPVCKTIRYLNKDMEFLINPECYHPMCSNCVNRLFNDGPNQCPYAGCHQTLRRKGFRSAFFGDLTVEREVDIRRRVAAVFNQVEDDFETLGDYNDYLQQVEDLTFDLVFSGADEGRRRKAEANLQQWEAEHKADIERNKKAGREADETARRRLAAEREAARQRRLEAAREAEEERLERVRSNEEALDQLAKGDGAAKVQLKRRGQQGRPVAAPAPEADGAAEVTGAAGRLSIRGLKEKKRAPESTGPYDPFAGYDFHPDRYKLRDAFASDWLDGFARDPKHSTGGYDVREYYARAMFDAFSGMGVFIGDEKETGSLDMSAREVADFGAGMAAEQSGPVVAPSIRMEVDDVFA
ncbi:CDK-activating kinase assembly factor [Coniochaeta ligniaria NRRL 30616]|uniref:RNA polymerase II transcription factor B subunit 3 n=1 Tax=Coniochaeta ligniaria NRRL 30616 TaxID=1408157 RepID=A0A1J7I8P3_9PEZI|nr:CDK-activating kinase assembly factor [Coniochaeta ligniaria NRRL 30616]